MRNIIFILLLFSMAGYGQGGFYLASIKQANNDPFLAASALFYYAPESIDSDASTDGTSLSGANVWEDLSGNGFHCTIGGGTFVLNIGSTGRQVQWTSSAYLDIPSDASLNLVPGTDEFTIVFRIGDGVNPGGSGYAVGKAPADTGLRTGAWFSGAGAWGGMYVGGTNTAPSPTTVAANALNIITVSTSAMNWWIDGTQIVTGGTVGTGDPGSQSWNIGGRTDGSYLAGSGYTMDLVVLIPGVITSGQRAAIEAIWQVN